MDINYKSSNLGMNFSERNYFKKFINKILIQMNPPNFTCRHNAFWMVMMYNEAPRGGVLEIYGNCSSDIFISSMLNGMP